MNSSFQSPSLVSGFEHINRYFDKRMQLHAAKILPGEFYVSLHGEMIVTVLGSCVSACVRDRVKGIGGMNHFMLPMQSEHSSEQWGSNAISSASRYGNWAMEFLINEILKQGGKKENLEIKVFGGGQVLSNMTNIGQRNISFVKYYLQKEGLEIVAMDAGGLYPRKVLYFPDTGAVKVRKLRTTANDTILQREKAYIDNIIKKPKEGEVELF
ncbi:MAG: chemoreceptor glutamine deamidase CheD [Pseudomonadales bacterium]|uniref:Probable chemoreceptor glutamine deamidase CheD n=1 Tax=Oleiphilus messinensis TaxID=141451 RepID=A0A1Y0IBE4_9GAMM|nr:chemoreceptor glutamine deamidase CheD [Oleiphilus messinensis]ARU57580.1 chemotaxis methylation stimulator of MCP proteins CheD [Oleiphilus messinensis]MCG8613485.1 chemoreceptor glutamine deamidase CheD [Pseudomonadales bacterium]